MNDFLKDHETLYHFSPSANSESLLARGIVPRLYPPNEYDTIAPGRLAQSCLCTFAHLKNYINDERVAHHPEPVVCVVDATALIGLRFGLDWTHAGTRLLFSADGAQPFVHLTSPTLDAYATASLISLGTISCFDVIPSSAFVLASALRIVGPRPPQYPVRP